MTGNTHNRLRQLQGLVTIDAWHTSPATNPGVVDLHVYVHFREARLGGQASDEIAFRMVLRQAEIRVSQTEPASYRLEPGEIWRGDEDLTGRVTRSSSINSDKHGRHETQLTLKPSGPAVTAKEEREYSDSAKGALEVETTQTLKSIDVAFSRNDRDHPTWILRPTGMWANPHTGEPVLEGRPWPAGQQRLLRLVRKKNRTALAEDSDILVKIACRREDLRFFDIHLRDKAGNFKKVPDEAPLRVAVQEYLKSCLTREGLPVGDMDSMFSIVILGEVVSEPGAGRDPRS